MTSAKKSIRKIGDQGWSYVLARQDAGVGVHTVW